MFHRYLRFFLLTFFTLSAFFSVAQLNLVQLSYLPFPGQTVAGVWHYADSLNHEYALVGTRNGISIVDVTNPLTPTFILQVPGISNQWHEVKSWGPFAYATTEGTDGAGINDGLQIIDLRYLPDSAPAHYWHGDGAIAGRLHKAHSIEAVNGYVYLNGHNVAGFHGGVIIADLVDPLNPHYLGTDSVTYCHDSFLRGDTMWTSDLTAGFSAYDISDKTHPVSLGSHATFSNFNHNAGLSDNSLVLFTTDEHNHAPLCSYSVSDLNNIDELDRYSVLNIVNSANNDEVHNVRVLNDFLVNSCYGSQVTIVDAARPNNLIEVGNFPIQTSLCWDADPYLPSGNILATGISTGLYVLAPTYIRACYLEGIVTDSMTALPLNDAHVQILLTYVSDSTKLTGEYRTGYPTAGTYDVLFSKPGYLPKLISGVVLTNGVLDSLSVQLVVEPSGIDEESSFTNSILVPNPFHESAELVIDPDIFRRNKFLQMKVKDVTGKVVRDLSHISSSKIKIYRNELGSGMYFYELMSGVKVVAKGKLVIE